MKYENVIYKSDGITEKKVTADQIGGYIETGMQIQAALEPLIQQLRDRKNKGGGLSAAEQQQLAALEQQLAQAQADAERKKQQKLLLTIGGIIGGLAIGGIVVYLIVRR